jgi:hypothetical protein
MSEKVKAPDVKAQVQAILNNVPSPSKYGGRGGNYRTNHDKKVVEFNFDWPRSARHPDEYGEHGKRAAQKMDEYDSIFYDQIQKPLEALGYTIDAWCW